MKQKYKVYLKLNLASLFFIAVSFISISLAWFAYSGLAKVQTEIDVKTWYIEFQKDNKPVSNDIVISLAEIYPGMETVRESVRIMNKGDSNAQLNYSIVSAKILNEELDSSTTGTDFIEDKISHDYPFHININMNKNYVLSKEDDSIFDVSISWPLDSGNDELDSEWGKKAYLYQQQEQEKSRSSSGAQVNPSIKIVISVKAEQYIEADETSDTKYAQGQLVLYDISKNTFCKEVSDTCIRTHVIDKNNKLGDNTVTLLPDLYKSYSSGPYSDYNNLLSSTSGSWNVNSRPLLVSDLLNVISSDVMDSLIIRNNISSTIIGDVKYNNRVDDVINKTIQSDGYFRFLNEKFNFLSTNRCYWLNNEYNGEKAFALTKVDDNYSKIFGELKGNSCSAVPVIIANK